MIVSALHRCYLRAGRCSGRILRSAQGDPGQPERRHPAVTWTVIGAECRHWLEQCPHRPVVSLQMYIPPPCMVICTFPVKRFRTSCDDCPATRLPMSTASRAVSSFELRSHLLVSAIVLLCMMEEGKMKKNYHIFSSQLRADQMPGPPMGGPADVDNFSKHPSIPQ